MGLGTELAKMFGMRKEAQELKAQTQPPVPPEPAQPQEVKTAQMVNKDTLELTYQNGQAEQVKVEPPQQPSDPQAG